MPTVKPPVEKVEVAVVLVMVRVPSVEIFAPIVVVAATMPAVAKVAKSEAMAI
ncbi:MAG: hypothetical protein PHS62_05440 [Patescibacteria group bacterium]|nr:hypothetical protein [Patescibacteria group bacterium]